MTGNTCSEISHRMKGGESRLRWKGRDLSLLLIVLLCATLLTWSWPAWNKMLASSYTRHIQTLHVSPVYQNKAEGEPKDGHEPRDKQVSKKEEKTVDENGRDMTKSDGTEILNLGDEKLEQEKNSGISPSKPEEPTPSQEPARKQISKSKESEGVCTYTKGKWILDNRKPLYSGFSCKQWLAPMWACRLTQRQDFAYEKLRWQPKDCQLEEFEGHMFLKRMRHKTLAFVGDSLGRQQFQSLMCMITGGSESSNAIDAGKEYGFIIPRGGKRPSGWAYRFQSTNTTVLYYWSASLCDLEPLNPSDPNTEYAMHLDRPPAFLRQFLPKFDVLVLNTGHHWNRGKLNANRWVMYVGGAPLTGRKVLDIGGAKNLTVHSIIKWVDSQLPRHSHLKAFYRSLSPRHFVNGEWNTGGSCNNTTPMSIGKELLQEESNDRSAASAIRGTGVELLDISALSQLRDEGHISRYSFSSSSGFQDCLHWCLPGVPDTWNEILFALLQPRL